MQIAMESVEQDRQKKQKGRGVYAHNLPLTRTTILLSTISLELGYLHKTCCSLISKNSGLVDQYALLYSAYEEMLARPIWTSFIQYINLKAHSNERSVQYVANGVEIDQFSDHGFCIVNKRDGEHYFWPWYEQSDAFRPNGGVVNVQFDTSLSSAGWHDYILLADCIRGYTFDRPLGFVLRSEVDSSTPQGILSQGSQRIQKFDLPVNVVIQIQMRT